MQICMKKTSIDIMPGLWQQQLTCQKGQLSSGYYLHDYHQDYHFVIIIIITILFIIMITVNMILTNIREKPFLFAPKQSSCLVCVECCAVLKRWKYTSCQFSCLSVLSDQLPWNWKIFRESLNRWNLPQTCAQYENQQSNTFLVCIECCTVFKKWKFLCWTFP